MRDRVGVRISDGRNQSVRYLTQQNCGVTRVLAAEVDAADDLSFKRQRARIQVLYERVKTEL
jgi:hypothetical protein